MDINEIIGIILPIVFIGVGIALIVFIIELVKLLKNVNTTVTDITKRVDPLLENVETMTKDIQPAITKVDPLMDRVQLTVDSLNLEMMRVDQILEDLSEITDSASSATTAVENITSAPLQAVNSVAARVRTAFGGKSASEESEQLAEQRVAVAKALEDYKAAEEKDAKKAESSEMRVKAADESQPTLDVDEGSPVPGAEPVIDPLAIEETSFFDDPSDAE